MRIQDNAHLVADIAVGTFHSECDRVIAGSFPGCATQALSGCAAIPVRSYSPRAKVQQYATNAKISP